MVSVNVVVIGNGAAGEMAARTARGLDPASQVTLIAEEPEPLYSPCIFGRYLSGEIGWRQLYLRSLADYERAGIRLRLGARVSRVDPRAKQVEIGDEGLRYDKLVIATGSRPAVPPIDGCALGGVFPLKTIADLSGVEAHLQRNNVRRAVVLGSGAVGLELAVSLRRRNLDVYLVEMLDWVLPKVLDREPAEMLSRRLRGNGIQVLTGRRVTRIEGASQVESIRLEGESLACDFVGLATGMRPRARLARDAGAALGASGAIAVDAEMRTSVEDVLACGDCVETLDLCSGESSPSLLWHTARHEAYVAGCRVVGDKGKYPGSLNFSTLDVFGLSVISTGTRSADHDAAAESAVWRRGDSYLAVRRDQDRVTGLQFVGNVLPPTIAALLGLIRAEASLNALERVLGGPDVFLGAGPWGGRAGSQVAVIRGPRAHALQ